MKRAGVFILTAVLLVTSLAGAEREEPEAWRAAMEGISTDSLRGHVWFLASDLLEGRDTPSHGLEIAAAYIAAQFRGAGLAPGGGDGYFQTSYWTLRAPNQEGLELSIHCAGKTIEISANQLATRSVKGLNLSEAAAVIIPLAEIPSLKAGEVKGRVLIVETPDLGGAEPSSRRQVSRETTRLAERIPELSPALVVMLVHEDLSRIPAPRPVLADPGNPPESGPPNIIVWGAAAAEIISTARSTPNPITVSARISPPLDEEVRLHNVIGVLRGSDAGLADTAVIISAHYDHLGVRPSGSGDRILNGANDNASGTAVVIELAHALASLPEKPKRSIVFMAFFGEERGMLGSRFYAKHPVFPASKTVANLNLEHLGRSDSTEGPQLLRASVTGFDYSDVGPILKEAGELTGIEVYKHKQNSDSFFTNGDNIRLAEQGIPAHTIAAAFLYSDYHRPADHWDKLDYENMTKVTRMIALGALMIADSDDAPEWNKDNPRTERFRKARQQTGQAP